MSILIKILIKLIQIYKILISPFLGYNCRYLPTCSDYSIEALKNFGFIKGITLILKRILKCHPWGGGGFDPIKKQIKVKK
jgi:putative membrane protein insertion efficiency factor